MRRLVAFVSIWVLYTNAQKDRIQRPFDNDHGWDIRLSVPGEPGNDYPILNSIPRTSFTCSGKEPGYYADIETNCQVFRVCTLGATYGYQSFLCPNGTLFNQAVFVCDWWMQVNCQKTTDIIKKNNDQFGKLSLGPEFMSDIKKMITHPMRNPYNSVFAKNNLISMQEYKPPTGQLYSGNNYKKTQQSLISFIPKVQQSQQNYFQDLYSNTDISFAASTPSTQYIRNFNSLNNQKQQVQQQNYKQLNKALNTNNALISNSHGVQSPYNNNRFITFNNSPNQSQAKSNLYNNRNLQTGRLTTYTKDYLKQQLNPYILQEQQLYPPGPTRAQYSRDIIGSVDQESKQNLVSNESKPRLITKTLAFRKLVKDSKDGTPRSRITFKTWIVRPSKNSKLFTNDTYSTNDKNINLTQKLGNETVSTTYITSNSPYNNKIVETYRYSNKFPPTFSRQVITPVQNVADSLTSSTTPYTSYKAFKSTRESPILLVPTTFKPYGLHISPIDKAKQISRQYLLPKRDYEELLAVASTPTPFEVPEENKYEPKLSIRKQSHVNTNNNNVTFTDILTKEKIDITINDIVKDTSEILETASPEDFSQFQKNTESLNYPIDNYLPPDSDIDQQSDEELILVPPPQLPNSSRLISALSPHLEPPFEDEFIQTFSSSNASNLSFFNKEKVPSNTIERTVSLKITIPENIAKYLFKSQNNKNVYNLELLNTASNKYLILTDNIANNSSSNFIPIGKLIKNTLSNISDSQDLVFSLLADSINTAKEYNNVVHQNLAKPTSTSQFYNIQTDNLGRISKDASQVLSSQPTRYQPANFEDTFKTNQFTPKVPTRNENYFKTVTQNQHLQPHNVKPQNSNNEQFYSSEYLRSTSNIVANPDKIYSGQFYQLPVPDVTRQIYNSPRPSVSNFILSNSFVPPYNQQVNTGAEVEIIPSQIIPTSSTSVLISKETSSDQGSSSNVFIDDFQVPKDAISAHIQDNIIGTIPHPEDNDKFIKYKKDQSYYFYSHLNGKSNNYEQNSNQTNNAYLLSNLTNPTFQLIPSVGYKLDDETEKQNFLNVFKIDDHGNPRQDKLDKNTNSNRRQDISSDVDSTVVHQTLPYLKQKMNDFNIVYKGSNSYSAPQASVGRLDNNKNEIKDSSFNARLEKLEIFNNDNGYPKITPVNNFSF